MGGSDTPRPPPSDAPIYIYIYIYILTCDKIPCPTSRMLQQQEAIESKVIEVEFNKTTSDEAEVTHEKQTISYAITGVCDVGNMRTVSYAAAVRQGILNERTGCFRNSRTEQETNILKAIAHGFIKAIKVDGDVAAVDIPVENRMYIDNVEVIRRRLVAPLSIICAMRPATPDSKMAATPTSNCGEGLASPDTTEVDSGTIPAAISPLVKVDRVDNRPKKAVSICSLSSSMESGLKRMRPLSTYAKHTQSSAGKISPKIDTKTKNKVLQTI